MNSKLSSYHSKAVIQVGLRISYSKFCRCAESVRCFLIPYTSSESFPFYCFLFLGDTQKWSGTTPRAVFRAFFGHSAYEAWSLNSVLLSSLQTHKIWILETILFWGLMIWDYMWKCSLWLYSEINSWWDLGTLWVPRSRTSVGCGKTIFPVVLSSQPLKNNKLMRTKKRKNTT